MKKIFFPSLIIMSALSLSSCLGSDDDNKSEGTLTYGGAYCFNHVTDRQTGESFISTDPQYSFLLDYSGMTITPSMSNLKLMSDGSGLAFKLPTMKVSTGSQEYSYACSGTELIPEGQSQAYVFNRFSFKAMERNIKTVNSGYIYSAVYDISYTVNNRYDVVVFPTTYYLLGTTYSTPVASTPSTPSEGEDQPQAHASDASGFTTTKPIYSITLDPKTFKASIVLYDAQFASGHSMMRVGVKDVPYTVTSTGVRIETEPGETIQLRDTTGDVAGAYMSDIKLNINVVPSSRGSYMSFKINVAGLQGQSGADIYDVTSNLSYYYPDAQN